MSNKSKNPKGGLINVYKAKGLSSRQVLNKLKKILNTNKLGHVGTLDPFADGVLPVAIGQATKVIRFMEGYSKSYRVLINFGEATTTQDLSGEIAFDIPISNEKLQEITADDFKLLKDKAQELSGNLTQTVPEYSAIKFQGKPLYWYARRGIQVPRKSREVRVNELKFLAAGVNEAALEKDIPLSLENLKAHANAEYQALEEFFPNMQIIDTGLDAVNPDLKLPKLWAIFDLDVSSGTYIRTWADDLAESLGIAGYALALRRLRTGPFKLENSFSLAKIEEERQEKPDLDLDYQSKNYDFLLNPALSRPDLPLLSINKENALKLLHGQRAKLANISRENPKFRVFYKDLFLGFAQLNESKEGPELKAERMFVTVEYFNDRFQ